MTKRSTRYQYQTTTKTIQSQITAPRIDYTQKTKTVTVSNPSKRTKREKIETAYRNNKEGGSWPRRTDITEVSRTAKVRSFREDKRYGKYAKYNQASQTLNLNKEPNINPILIFLIKLIYHDVYHLLL